jgi:probable addiction module antidote protein
MKKTSSYKAALFESLRTNPEEAEAYLNAAYEDSPEAFLKALGNVAQANQMSKVAKETGVQRESLYRALSGKGNPTFETLRGVLAALGMKLSITRVEDGIQAIHPSEPPIPSEPLPALVGWTEYVIVPQVITQSTGIKSQRFDSLEISTETAFQGYKAIWNKGAYSEIVH